LFKAPVTTSYI